MNFIGNARPRTSTSKMEHLLILDYVKLCNNSYIRIIERYPELYIEITDSSSQMIAEFTRH